jgi:glycosyltransferase involved in cell wall biosynthesis
MIVKNEERNLPLSLGPLIRLADEAVVLDTGSADGTKRIAREMGATVRESPWPDDFSLARNTALFYATTDFVMWLDADNQVDPDDFRRLKETISASPLNRVFVLEELVVPQGDRLRQKRVFPRVPGVCFQGRIHEQLVHPASFEVRYVPTTVRHWGYADPLERKRKGERNLALLLSAPETLAGDFYHLYQTGRTLLNLRRQGEALEFLDRAARKPDADPSLWSHVMILKAQILTAFRRDGEALQSLGELVERRPRYGLGRYFLGKTLHRLGRDREALEELKLASSLGLSDSGWGAPRDKITFTCAQLLGRLLLATRKEEEAREAFSKAAEINPDNPEPRVALAEIAAGFGRAEEARFHLEEALRLSPGHRRARDIYQGLIRGEGL